MKFARTFAAGAICGVVLVFAASAYAQSTDAKQGHITVLRIQGAARYSLGDNVWHPLTVGQTLGAGAVMQSGINSTVDITVSDNVVPLFHPPAPGQMNALPAGPGLVLAPFKATAQQDVMRLTPDTVLAIDKLLTTNTGADVVKDTELDLRKGHIFGDVKKVSAASVFLVKVPTGIAGIRGTAFSINADGVLTVFQGSVVVSVNVRLSNGTTTTVAEVVSAGEQFNPADVRPVGTSATGGNTVTTTTTGTGTATTTGITTTTTTGTSTGTTTATGPNGTTTTVNTGITKLTPVQEVVALVQAITGNGGPVTTTTGTGGTTGTTTTAGGTTTATTSTGGGLTVNGANIGSTINNLIIGNLEITTAPVTVTETITPSSPVSTGGA